MIKNVYPRTIRPNANGFVSTKYVAYPEYCTKPLHYIRAARVIAKDLERMFDYVEPSDQNLRTHSFEILGLLSRVCFEVEANLKDILLANKYSIKDGLATSRDLTMQHYCKLEQSHFLSRYIVVFPQWSDNPKEFRPFGSWESTRQQRLGWYQDFNQVKHNRIQGFQKANMENLCNSFAALVALLTSQFWDYDPSSQYGTKHFTLDAGCEVDPNGYIKSLIDGYYFKLHADFSKPERYNLDATEDFNFEPFAFT